MGSDDEYLSLGVYGISNVGSVSDDIVLPDASVVAVFQVSLTCESRWESCSELRVCWGSLCGWYHWASGFFADLGEQLAVASPDIIGSVGSHAARSSLFQSSAWVQKRLKTVGKVLGVFNER